MTAEQISRQINRDSFRQNLCRYTWQAYHLLPPINEPRILDLGCGSGIPAIELAVLSQGQVTAVDMDRKALAGLEIKIKALNLQKHIRIMAGDFRRLKVKREYFDIAWCEGSIGVMGFETGLCTWREFLKPGGFMVVHEEKRDYKEKLALIPACGYILVDHFPVPADIWLKEYFRPLQQRITELKDKYAEEKETLDLIAKEENEIELFKNNPNDYATVFYIMRRTE